MVRCLFKAKERLTVVTAFVLVLNTSLSDNVLQKRLNTQLNALAKLAEY